MAVDVAGGVDLESLGFPIANAENKKLEAEVQRKEKEISSLQQRIEEHSDRVQAIRDHLKNVRQELQQTQVGYVLRSSSLRLTTRLPRLDYLCYV